MNDERKEYIFLWSIENYSYCWHEIREGLKSPEFTADGLEGTTWYLELFPRGEEVEDKGYISVFICRSNVDKGPEDFLLKFQLSILSEGKSILYPFQSENIFKRGVGYGENKLLRRDEILMRRKAECLPQDTLRVLCKFWIDRSNVQQIAARTRIAIEQISFLHVTESFSTLAPNQKKTIDVRSSSKNGLSLSSTLYYSDDSCCEGKIIVEITPFDANKILTICKISLVDQSGNLIECCEADNRLGASRKDIQKLSLSLTRQVILKRKSKYLPGDKLSLKCECIFSRGVELETIEKTLHQLPAVSLTQIYDTDLKRDRYNAVEKLNACSSALDDFKSLYNNQLLTDFELKTKTKSFSVHKFVLCARSSVFEAMLTRDMKEKITNCIQIHELGDDTVQQLLLFLYADNIENMEWESAIKLYYAGDKYAIEKLKVLCASFLVSNITPSSAGELLLLADTHNDSDLKKAVEDFIFKHEEEVYASEEWSKLIKTNPVLVSETMCLKYQSSQ